MSIVEIVITKEQEEEVKVELQKLKAIDIIKLHNASDFGSEYSTIYKFNKENINRLYNSAWEMSCCIQDFVEAGVYEDEYFCVDEELTPRYVSEITSTLIDDTLTPINFKAIYKLLIQQPELALEHNVKLGGANTPKPTDESNDSIKNELVAFIKDNDVLDSLSIEELRLFFKQHLHRINDQHKKLLLEKLLG